jgi:hypothetical protein
LLLCGTAQYKYKVSVFTERFLITSQNQTTTQKEKTMKSILSTVWQFMCDLGHASYAAHLARNGQVQRAQAMYKK